MAVWLGIAGLVLGFAFAQSGIDGFGSIFGAAVGALIGICIRLAQRVGALETRLSALSHTVSARAQHAATATAPSAVEAAVVVPPERTPGTHDTTAADFDSANSDGIRATAMSAPTSSAAASRPLPPPLPNRPTTQPNELAEAATPTRRPPPLPDRAPATTPREVPALARWLFESSWIAKIGIALVFIGVGALLRLAIRQGWLDFPIELRLVGIALAALAALGFGWRQREHKRIFALNVQGGALGVLMMVAFAAYRLYHLIPASATFALLLVLVAGTAVLAIRQNSLGLAVFGVVGGFAAPILASTGDGNHVALFSFYLVLNLAILAISSMRGWRVLNTIGFLFTFIIATAWGVLRYQPQHFATTEPFLIAFFLFYLAIPLLPALRGIDPNRRDHVEGTLVFGTPLVGFALQTAMLHDNRPALAYTALAMALIYLALAVFVWQRARLARWRAAYAGLALVFGTLVIPLAFTSGTTAVLWAIEGALLTWIGLAQDERRLRWAGLALQAVALVALLDTHAPGIDAVAFANPRTLGAAAIAIAAWFSAWRYQRHGAGALLISVLSAYAYATWTVGGALEVDRLTAHPHGPHMMLLFFALTAVAATILRRPSGLEPLSWPGVALLLAVLPFVLITAQAVHAPLAERGIWVWPLAWAACAATLAGLRDPWLRGLGWAHAAAWLSLPLAFALEVNARTAHMPLAATSVLGGFGGDWPFLFTFVPFWIALAVLLARVPFAGFPVAGQFPKYRVRVIAPLAAIGLFFVLLSCFLSGAVAPTPYLPLLNGVELSQIGVLLLIAWFAQRDLSGGSADALRVTLAVVAFGVVSAAVLRGVHHYGDESWTIELLTRPKAHAALSWTWTLLGAAAMGFGARALIRGAWIAGAVLLGIVVVKLLLIDMRFLGTMAGIVSVLGVGVLFVALGYFAPMPRDDATAEESAT